MLNGKHHIHQMKGINDPDPPARTDSKNGLGIGQVRRHIGVPVQEKLPKVPDRPRCILFFPCENISRCEEYNIGTHLAHDDPMSVKIVRIGLSVPLYVWQSIRRIGIWPPIIAVGVIIMGSACAARALHIRDMEHWGL